METRTEEEWAVVGERIRAARQNIGMSVRELARRIDVSASHVSQVERGNASFSVRALYTVAGVLGISMDSLFATDELDLRLIDLGRAQAVKFRTALEAGRVFQSPEAIAEAQAAADGARRMWAPVLADDQALRNETFGLFFGLPGRCEHAARRISLNITAPPPTLADVGLEAPVPAR